jgi:hypothetical protein
MLLAACGGSAMVSTSGSTSTSTPPTITGSPPPSATVGSAYSFAPTVNAASGVTLAFSIKNAPPWATFSATTGSLTGTPAASDVGTDANVTISVGDGTSTVSLAPFTITVSAAPATLSSKYRGDVGIGSDPAVVWYENFQEGSVARVVGRYDSYTNSGGMSLAADAPANTSGAVSMQLTAGGSNRATQFYKSFGAGYDELYFRYYAKYVGNGPWHHTGLWIGGYNPPLPYPYPRAGEKPNGDDWYSIGLEPIPSYTGAPMDFYTYWRGMQSWMSNPTGAVGDYYGDTLLHNAGFRMQSDTWVCYEIHLKLNPDPSTDSGAVLEVWQNDSLVRRFDDTGPLGYWVKDKFCPVDADGTECIDYRPANPTLVLLDQQWRTTSALKIDYFWPQNYNDASRSSSLLLGDMVVAKQRIGCTVKQ